MKIDHKRIVKKVSVKDAKGGEHTVVFYTQLLETTPTATHPGRGWLPGQDVYVALSDKRPVNVIDNDTFEIVTTGEILKTAK